VLLLLLPLVPVLLHRRLDLLRGSEAGGDEIVFEEADTNQGVSTSRIVVSRTLHSRQREEQKIDIIV